MLRTHGAGVRVRVVFDPEDMGEIQVWAPDTQDPITVRALDWAYAKGLTQHQNQLVRRLLQEKGAAKADAAALQQARSELIGMVQELMGSRKLRDRKRSARILGQSSTKPDVASHIGADRSPQAERPKVAKRSQDMQPPREAASGRPPLILVGDGDQPAPTFRLARWDEPPFPGGRR